MKNIHYEEIEPKVFESDLVKGVSGRVLIGAADGAPFCMRLFTVDSGGHTPRHTHAWEHEIFFHQGRGQVFNRGQWQDVRPGSAVFVPAGVEHQVRNNSGDLLVFVCLVPAEVPEL